MFVSSSTGDRGDELELGCGGGEEGGEGSGEHGGHRHTGLGDTGEQ